jgi:hypothetical protein
MAFAMLAAAAIDAATEDTTTILNWSQPSPILGRTTSDRPPDSGI